MTRREISTDDQLCPVKHRKQKIQPIFNTTATSNAEVHKHEQRS